MFEHERSVTVEWGDCDPAGIVFYPRYFAMFDASTAALFHAVTGMTKFELLRHYGVVGFPMVDTRAKFAIPSRFGDVIRIRTRVTALRRLSFDVSHTVMRGEASAIEGSETRVWAARHPDDPDRIQGVPIPSDLIERLTKGPAANNEEDTP
jgi:4-hydroxybenzoyl-CoA thioesterase